MITAITAWDLFYKRSDRNERKASPRKPSPLSLWDSTVPMGRAPIVELEAQLLRREPRSFLVVTTVLIGLDLSK